MLYRHVRYLSSQARYWIGRYGMVDCDLAPTTGFCYHCPKIKMLKKRPLEIVECDETSTVQWMTATLFFFDISEHADDERRGPVAESEGYLPKALVEAFLMPTPRHRAP